MNKHPFNNKYFLFSATYLHVLAFSLSALMLSTACEQSKQRGESTRSAAPEMRHAPVQVDADSAFAYVAHQVAFGPRVPNSPQHVACGNYLIEELRRTTDTVIVQSFEAEAWNGLRLQGRNIIASINPGAAKRILLAAHWDTRPYADQEEDPDLWEEPIDGANDGASGVAVLLEIARTIYYAEEKPKVGIDIILFDLEDYGTPSFAEKESRRNDTYCLGSQYWAENKHKRNYHAYFGILLDMVGGKDAIFTKEGTSMRYAPKIVEKVWKHADFLGYSNYFSSQETDAIIDDHTYINAIARIPTIDIVQYDPSNEGPFFEHWHTHNDTLENIDKRTLASVGQVVLQVLYNE